MVAKHVNKKNAGKPRFLAINALLLSIAALHTTFSAVTFYYFFTDDDDNDGYDIKVIVAISTGRNVRLFF